MKNSLVTCHQIKKYFETKSELVKALDDINLDILEADFIAFAGPSGSGKTTLLNLIGMLDSPTAGDILIRGRSILNLGRAAQANMRKKEIGFIFQAYNLIPVLTVQENVEYVMMLQGISSQERHQRSKAVLEEVGLGGLEKKASFRVIRGQQQRVAVARAIASRPAIVLADEPTANLDSVTGVALIDTMEHLNREHGLTFIFSTHDPMVMKRASRLIQLKDGKIQANSRHVA